MFRVVIGLAAVVLGASWQPPAGEFVGSALVEEAGARSSSAPAVDAAVFSRPNDPYRSLAVEIARVEALALVESLADLTPPAPRHVLWVAAPGSLSDEEMISAGRFLQDNADISIGIITGSTPQHARDLWLRAGQASGTRAAYAIAKDPRTGVGIPIGLVVDEPAGKSEHRLTKQSFVEYLSRVDYMTFAGHGGAGYLGLPERARVGPADLPDLPPVVVTTASCNTLRPWAPGSLALAFVDNGAAAYAGFVYSPISGYLLGQYRDLAYRYTWPDFTVGEVIRIQNRGTLRGFASFPYFFLLGDPRLHLRDDAPYRLGRDETSAGERILQYDDVPAGVIPLLISNGAGYDFVEIPGVDSVGEGDLFYNGRIQTGVRGDDKLLLIVHAGGPLNVVLRRSPPWHRAVVRPVRDALDHTFVYLPQTGVPAPAFGLAVWLFALLWGRRAPKEMRLPFLGRSLVTGFVVAALIGLYVFPRSGSVAVTSKAVTTSAWVVVDLFFLLSAAAYVFFLSRSWRGRAAALALGAFPALGPALFSLVGLSVVNWQMDARLGVGLYSHHMVALSAISLLVLLPLLLVVFAAGISDRQ